MKRPTFTLDELKTLWPRLNRGAQATYLEMAKASKTRAERYLRVQFDWIKQNDSPKRRVYHARSRY